MNVRIPFGGKSKANEPLRRVIQRTADACATSQFKIATVMAAFLEGVVLELCHGQIVRLPGFGAFGVVRFEPGGKHAAYAAVRFAVGRPLRNEIAMCASPDPIREPEFWKLAKRYRPSKRPDKKHSVASRALRLFREDVERQAKHFGQDAYFNDEVRASDVPATPQPQAALKGIDDIKGEDWRAIGARVAEYLYLVTTPACIAYMNDHPGQTIFTRQGVEVGVVGEDGDNWITRAGPYPKQRAAENELLYGQREGGSERIDDTKPSPPKQRRIGA